MHADARLLERTDLNPEVLHRLRRVIRGKKLPAGSLHVTLEGGHHAQLKHVAPGHHVVATVLRQNMQPGGTDVTHLLTAQRAFLEKRAAKSTPKQVPAGVQLETDHPFWGLSQQNRDTVSSTVDATHVPRMLGPTGSYGEARGRAALMGGVAYPAGTVTPYVPSHDKAQPTVSREAKASPAKAAPAAQTKTAPAATKAPVAVAKAAPVEKKAALVRAYLVKRAALLVRDATKNHGDQVGYEK